MNKNQKTLQSFVKYCEENPDQRFWQALVSWSGYSKIWGQKTVPPHVLETGMEDTYYIE